ncbi:MAG: fatty acyl-AMP ligase [Myxococcales bacterium]|nr:fatty acyl-AMP ligase [Myxococcales bacterium]
MGGTYMPTINDLLEHWATEQPSQPALTFLEDGEIPGEELTFLALANRAREIAAALREYGSVGDRVALIFPPEGLEFAKAFLGCFYAGVIPVPISPPLPREPNMGLDRTGGILRVSEPKCLVTTSGIAEIAGPLLSQMGNLPILSSDAVEGTSRVEEIYRPRGSDIAFLQFTSGSTGMPRGVCVTHENLVANDKVIAENYGIDATGSILNWLPLYHDMGLIGHLLQAIYSGSRLFLMSPVDFLRDPSRWVRAVSKYQVNFGGGPNFSLDLCVRKTPAAVRDELDLSSWKALQLGGEPVRAASVRRFLDYFGPAGLHPATVAPCYGLAEATLYVCGGRPSGEPARVGDFSRNDLEEGRHSRVEGEGSTIPLVSMGTVAEGHNIHILKPNSLERVKGNEVGEICIAGPSVTAGYWGDRDATAKCFIEFEGERVLRSGDLGFLEGGCLYVTGRIKDLIIVQGRNLYPQDLETIAESATDGVRPGCSAAFGLDTESSQKAVIVVEVERRKLDTKRPSIPPPGVQERRSDSPPLLDGFEPKKQGHGEAARRAIERALFDAFSVAATVVTVAPGNVPKTSSGKVQRGKARSLWKEGRLTLVD